MAEHIFVYEHTLNRRNIQSSAIRVVTDSASNMIKDFDLPGFEDGDFSHRGGQENKSDLEEESESVLFQFQAEQVTEATDHYFTKSNFHL